MLSWKFELLEAERRFDLHVGARLVIAGDVRQGGFGRARARRGFHAELTAKPDAGGELIIGPDRGLVAVTAIERAFDPLRLADVHGDAPVRVQGPGRGD